MSQLLVNSRNYNNIPSISDVISVESDGDMYYYVQPRRQFAKTFNSYRPTGRITSAPINCEDLSAVRSPELRKYLFSTPDYFPYRVEDFPKNPEEFSVRVENKALAVRFPQKGFFNSYR